MIDICPEIQNRDGGLSCLRNGPFTSNLIYITLDVI